MRYRPVTRTRSGPGPRGIGTARAHTVARALLGTSILCAQVVPPRAHGLEALGGHLHTPAAQEPGGGVLTGRVLIGDLPADSGTVVLHRVSERFSGGIDSVAVGIGGAFAFELPGASGDGTEDVFFATFRHQDVVYIGAAITAAPTDREPYLIRAYPAVPAGAASGARILIRNLFVEALGPGSGWAVADYFELENDAPVTLVAGADGSTWSHALPPGADDFQVGRSDLQAGAARLRDGRVGVSAPMRPGVSVYLFRYVVSSDRFSVPMEGTTGSMELLVREPAGELSVTGLAHVPEVEIEGIRYRRFAGREMAPSVVTVVRGVDRGPLGPIPPLAILLALALAGAGALVAARSRPVRKPGRAGRPRRDVLVAVASLDERRGAGLIAEKDYERRRARLLKELEG